MTGFTIAALVFGVLLAIVLQQQGEIRQLAEDSQKLGEENRRLGKANARLTKQTRRLFERMDRQNRVRRDQACTLFERDHLADTRALGTTYRFLRQLTPAEQGTALTQIVAAGVPESEREAGIDSAPDYCDAKGVGLAEPDPTVPCRPPDLRVALPPPTVKCGPPPKPRRRGRVTP